MGKEKKCKMMGNKKADCAIRDGCCCCWMCVPYRKRGLDLASRMGERKEERKSSAEGFLPTCVMIEEEEEAEITQIDYCLTPDCVRSMGSYSRRYQQEPITSLAK